jgi:polysaccharide export outer membrane protein
MKAYFHDNFKLLLFTIVLAGFLSSCASSKRAIYFNDQPDGTISNTPPALQQTINPNDILSITVSSLNPEASVIFNSPTSSSNAATGTAVVGRSFSGYLVEQDGSIQFPVLGKMQVAGLTKSELTEFLRKTLVDKKLLIDPIVTINFLNFRVTVLGEVLRPMVVNVPNEKISLLEAIGMAGDLTIYARRDNVLLIREEKGKRILKRLNLNSGNIFTSPYYYLKSNDIVYAEPNGTKIFSSSDTRQLLPLIVSVLSLAVIAVWRLKL